MNFKTFYNIYYRHRILKASFFLKIYLLLSSLFKYFLNLFYFPKKNNLDNLSIKKNFLFDQDLNYLFEFFNSDKEIVAASDAFFPFVDGVEKLIQSGVTAIIQPYGSIKDNEIIRFANSTNTILVYSKTRHFKH